MNRANENRPNDPDAPIHVDLRDAAWAALLGWLVPGSGHLYQRRYAKGVLYMVTILGTFFYGLSLGHGHVVYASWRHNDYRWQYFCQLGVGLPAFPAMIQSMKIRNGGDPMFITNEYDPNSFEAMRDLEIEGPLKEGFMAPPPGPIFPNQNDVLGVWHDELKHKFEIGTLYTIVAGLLNLLAVYDAFAGPAFSNEGRDEEDSPDEDGPDDGDSS